MKKYTVFILLFLISQRGYSINYWILAYKSKKQIYPFALQTSGKTMNKIRLWTKVFR